MTDIRTTIPLWQSVKTVLHEEKPTGLSWNAMIRAITIAWKETPDKRKLEILSQEWSSEGKDEN